MRSELGRYIRQARRRRELNQHEVAQRLGYSPKGTAKGSRRLQQLETEGLESTDFIERILSEFDLDPDEARRLAQVDQARRRETWERWADAPIRPFVILNCGPHFWLQVTRRVPERFTSLAACEGYAGRVIAWLNDRPRPARLRAITARLVWTRRLDIWFDAQGRVIRRTPQTYEDAIALPHVEVGGKRITL